MLEEMTVQLSRGRARERLGFILHIISQLDPINEHEKSRLLLD